MHRQQQHVLRFTRTQQRRAPDRPPLKVEGAHGLLGGEPSDLRLRLGRAARAEVDDRQIPLGRGVDNLRRLVADHPETRAQRFVATGDLAQTAAQRLDLQRAFEPHRRREVEGGALRLQLLKNPQPLLRVGERRRAAPLATREGRLGRGGAALTRELLRQHLELGR
jgi:hypothetical protein